VRWRSSALLAGSLVAVVATAAAVLVRLALSPWLGNDAPLIVLALGVMAAASFRGLWSGLLATALAMVAGTLLFLEPPGSLHVQQAGDVIRLVLFGLLGITISVVSEKKHAARRHNEAKQRQLEGEIRERQRAVAESEAASQQLVTTLESLTDGFMRVDPEWRITYVNAAIERDSGLRRGDLLGRSFWGAFPATLGTVLERQYRWSMADRVPRHFEHYYAPYSRWFEVSVSPTPDGGLAAHGRDITARKQAEEALRESEARLRLAQQVAHMGTFDWNIETGLNVWSPEQEALYGLPPGGFARTPEAFHELIHPDDLPHVLQRVAQSMETGDFEDEWRVVLPDSSVRWVHGRTKVFKNESGKPARMLGVNIDTTARKLTEEALKASDRHKDEFLAILAHELRNPLAPIRNAVQILKLKRSSDPEIVWCRDVIDRQAQQLARLIDDLLDVSRIAHDKLELRKERVELPAVFQSAVETSRPLIDAGGHELAITLPAAPVHLDADPVRLAQALSNLLNNAAKYTKPGGHIRLIGERQGSEVVVSVTDDGIGISAEAQASIFEIFAQAKPAVEWSQGGLGIGLSLVKGLVGLHGGSIETHSRGPGTGSQFIVRLPLAAETPVDGSADATEGGGESRVVSRRCLVADDNRDSADSLAKMLEIMGHEVQTAYDGEEAVSKAATLEPEVVLLDIGMPKLNGYDACRLIRERPWGKGILVIALTGWGKDQDRRRAEEAGFDRHMVKPVDPAALGRLIESV
jgi:PAS domain S-box-containing protein